MPSSPVFLPKSSCQSRSFRPSERSLKDRIPPQRPVLAELKQKHFASSSTVFSMECAS